MKQRLLITAFLLLPVLSGRLGAQDPDIVQDDSTEAAGGSLTDIWRSSEEDGAQPVGRRQAGRGLKRVSVPRGAFRFGCICMDDSFSPTRSSGACSGHGGVRFWLYRTREGDTVRVQTGQHERHPEALSADEMSVIVQKREEKVSELRKNLAPQPYGPVTIMPADDDDSGPYAWLTPVSVSVLMVGAFIILRMLLRWINKNEKLVRYALRHFIRPRKRPPARKSRKTTRKTRL